MIDVQSLTAKYANRTVVDELSFSLPAGTVVGFLGPNGAGKSTTMRMLCGNLTPHHGTARILGHDIIRNRRAAQALTGYLPEAARGFNDLCVSEFLTFCAEARGFRGKRLRERMNRVSEQIELGAAMTTSLNELSKGWRQRVWFAQALLHDPPVLILDEPTDGLDPNQKRRIRTLIREFASEKTILLSTHILEEAEELCQRTIIINKGQIVADCPTSDMTDAHGRLSQAFYQLTGDDEDPHNVHAATPGRRPIDRAR